MPGHHDYILARWSFVRGNPFLSKMPYSCKRVAMDEEPYKFGKQGVGALLIISNSNPPGLYYYYYYYYSPHRKGVQLKE